MNSLLVFQAIAAAAAAFTLIAFTRRMRVYRRLARPVKAAPPRGSRSRGVLYAYTLGMAPWSKESTRLHALSYLRGVFFYLGIFLGLGLLAASPWVPGLPDGLRLLLAAGSAAGALLGLTGFAARWLEPNLKALSTPDDYFAVLLVSLYLAAAALWLRLPQAGPLFYLLGAAVLVYALLGKIRHCIYFAYSRLFFGRFFGERSVLPHGQQLPGGKA